MSGSGCSGTALLCLWALLCLQALPPYTCSSQCNLAKKLGRSVLPFTQLGGLSPLCLLISKDGGRSQLHQLSEDCEMESKGNEAKQGFVVFPTLRICSFLLLPCSSSLCLFLSISRETGYASYPTCEVWLKSIEIQLLSMKNIKFFLKKSQIHSGGSAGQAIPTSS